MENTRFDAMARRLGAAVTRRSTLKGLVAIVAGGAVASSIDSAKAGTWAPIRAPRTCRVSGYFCTRDQHCCGDNTGRCLVGRQVPRRLRNRCACIPDLEVGCWKDSDCCGNTGTGDTAGFTCNWWGSNDGPRDEGNGGLCCMRPGAWDCESDDDCCVLEDGRTSFCQNLGSAQRTYCTSVNS